METEYSIVPCSSGGAFAFLKPCLFVLSRTIQNQTLKARAFLAGSYLFRFTDPTLPPISIIFSSDSEAPYFEKYSDIQPSCCNSSSLICGKKAVTLISSCSWSADYITKGIVYVSYDGLTAPVSLAGVGITSDSATLPNINSRDSCSPGCELTPLENIKDDDKCYKHIPTPDDLREFVKRQSLTKSFLSSIRSALFPSWFNISITNDLDALNKLSNTDYLAKLVSSNILLSERGCESLVIEDKNEGRFLVLQHNGPLNLKIEDEQPLLQSPSLSDYYCIAVHVCSGQNSPVYIGLPPSAQDGIKSIGFILNYVRKGWKFDFKSASLSKTPQDSMLKERLWNGHSYAEHSSRVNLRYDTLLNMEAQGRFSYEMANVNLNFSGFVRYKYTTRRDEVSLHIMNILIVYCYIIIIIRPI